jgi:ectoine hydroxylase-related dioxygenase (phytanoyl-CoA dioxygenase family)
MESVDRQAMCAAAYPGLQALRASGQLDAQQIAYAVAACAEGYAFPTNLDRDPPAGGLAPPSQQALMLLALQESWPVATFHSALRAYAEKRLA